MGQTVTITYLLNSGFLVEGGGWTLVFDDFQDTKGAVEQALARSGRCFFFVSHAHFDHFSPEIRRFADRTERYILSDDIKGLAEGRRFPVDKSVWLGKYDGWEGEGIRVTSFDSTDQGTSFLVEIGGWRIFHAGDFNWWHWYDESDEDNKLAKNGFMKQMKKLDGLDADLAFFPADGRLRDARSLGPKEFCRRTAVKALATMHSVGYPRWQPEPDFFAPGREIPVWAPDTPGERRTLTQGGEFTP